MADKHSPIIITPPEGSKVFLMGGPFEHIPVPGHKSFEQEEPSWMSVVKPGEKKL